MTSLPSCTTHIGVTVGSWAMGLVFADFGYQPVGLACGLASILAALIFRVQRRQQGS